MKLTKHIKKCFQSLIINCEFLVLLRHILASHLKEGQWASKMWKWIGSLKWKKIYTVKEHFLYVTGGEIVVKKIGTCR